MCEHVILHGKQDFADVVKLRILKYMDCPGLSWDIQVGLLLESFRRQEDKSGADHDDGSRSWSDGTAS